MFVVDPPGYGPGPDKLFDRVEEIGERGADFTPVIEV